MSCPADSVLEVLDLTLSFDVASKQVLVDVFSKPANRFPRWNIEMDPERVTFKVKVKLWHR